MPVPMPLALVLIVCKTVVAGPDDPNASFTGYENRTWATEGSMMVCRRMEVSLYDPTEGQPGTEPQQYNEMTCQRAGLVIGTQWDAAHRGSQWRFWRVACPVKIVRKNPDGSEDTIGWKMPDCGHRETVRCEVDTEI